MKILMSAFSCCPNSGSEEGVGWNWAVEAAKLGHQVMVVTQVEFRDRIEAELATGRLPAGLAFDFFMPSWLRTLRDGLFNSPLQRFALQIVHLVWQIVVVSHVRKTHLGGGYHFVHHITYGGIRHPTLLYKLPLPLVLGPLGGGESCPMALRRGLGWRAWLIDCGRDLHTWLLRFDPITRGACRHARVVYGKTQESLAALPLPPNTFAKARMEIGIHLEDVPAPSSPRTRSSKFRIIYAGKLAYFKGMHLGLRAVGEAMRRGLDCELTMLGTGQEEASWKKIAREEGIDGLTQWRGHILHQDMSAAYQAHDLMLFPSLHDSSGNVVLEALSNGLPVVCLALGGPAQMVDATCGRIVPVDNCNERECINRLADTLMELAADRELLARLSDGALAHVKTFDWSLVVANVYREVQPLIEADRLLKMSIENRKQVTPAKVDFAE